MRMCVGVNFTSGMLLWCGIFFVPLFVQEVARRHADPRRVRAHAADVRRPRSARSSSGRRVERTGRYRIWPLERVGGDAGRHGRCWPRSGSTRRSWRSPAFALVLGTGVGFVMQPSLLAAQNSAPQRDLGTATSTALLFRSLGNTIGIPIFGGILNAGLAGRARRRGRVRRRHPDDLHGRGAGGRAVDRVQLPPSRAPAPRGRAPRSRGRRTLSRFRDLGPARAGPSPGKGDVTRCGGRWRPARRGRGGRTSGSRR